MRACCCSRATRATCSSPGFVRAQRRRHAVRAYDSSTHGAAHSSRALTVHEKYRSGTIDQRGRCAHVVTQYQRYTAKFVVRDTPVNASCFDERYSLYDFAREPRGGFRMIARYMVFLAAHRDEYAAVHVTRYEQLLADTVGELRRILSFIGAVAVTEAQARAAVAEFDFASMHRMEMEGGRGLGGKLQPSDVHNRASFKTREGRVGGYREHFSAKQLAMLDAQLARAMVDAPDDVKYT